MTGSGTSGAGATRAPADSQYPPPASAPSPSPSTTSSARTPSRLPSPSPNAAPPHSRTPDAPPPATTDLYLRTDAPLPSLPRKDLPPTSTPTHSVFPPRPAISTHTMSSGAPGKSATMSTLERIAAASQPPTLRVTTATAGPSLSPSALPPSPPPSRPVAPRSGSHEAKAAIKHELHVELKAHKAHKDKEKEKNFLKKMKKEREQFHTQLRTESAKVSKFLGKTAHSTWGKLKSQNLGPKHGGHRSSSPIKGEWRDTSNDVDVFGMALREAVGRTRVVSDRKREGDATFWMPAIAYRCLQYLNVYGPHEVGIYRISGSTSVVDELRTAFKIHHDVDLFENPPDDLHTVSSLLKGWFRSLPDPILPLDVQKRIYDRCKDRTDDAKPPRAFVEELSNLPPYNYYLLHHLFSHLSTICLACNVNKMNLANLGMIFCSTLRLDRFCFNWLVTAWSDCWAGCATEEAEYELLRASRPALTRNASVSTVATARTDPAPGIRESPAIRSPIERPPPQQSFDHDDRRRENGEPRSLSMVVETNASPRSVARESIDEVALARGVRQVQIGGEAF